MGPTSSGSISLGSINTLLSRSATAPISMNDQDVRFLANQDTGSVTMNNTRNKYWFSGTITSASFLGDDFTQNYGKDQFNGAVSISGDGFFNGFNSFSVFATDVVFGTRQTVQPGSYPNIGSGRLQVGSNSIATMAFTSSGAGDYYQSLSTNAILAADVGVARAWRWATV